MFTVNVLILIRFPSLIKKCLAGVALGPSVSDFIVRLILLGSLRHVLNLVSEGLALGNSLILFI